MNKPLTLRQRIMKFMNKNIDELSGSEFVIGAFISSVGVLFIGSIVGIILIELFERGIRAPMVLFPLFLLWLLFKQTEVQKCKN